LNLDVFGCRNAKTDPVAGYLNDRNFDIAANDEFLFLFPAEDKHAYPLLDRCY
jgi:hypothetical protein